MGYIPTQQSNTGSYVPTTNIWDVARLYDVDINSEEFRELLVRLYQNVNNITLVLNTKDSAFYLEQEFASGQIYFNPNSTDPNDLRPSYRIIIDTGALAAGVNATNHNLDITDTWTFTKIIGAASNSGALLYYPLPFAGTSSNNIQVTVSGTQVIINNQSGQIFNSSYILLEYLKS